MPPPEMKQQSLTKFFTRKTVNGLAASYEKSQQEQKQQASSSSAKASSPAGTSSGARLSKSIPKRPLEEDIDGGNGSGRETEKPAKRSRSSARKVVEDVGDDDDHQAGGGDEGVAHGAVEGPRSEDSRPELKKSQPEKPRPEGDWTQRFRYNMDDDAMQVDDIDEDTAAREQRHRRFVAKIGHPDSLKKWNDTDARAVEGEEDEAGDEDAEETPPPPPPKGAKKKGGKTKLTPMEVQFLDIKRKHMDTLLIVEVGYKFRFFGEDARIASQELGIMCMPGKFRYDEHPSEVHLDRFASASIPVHRLHVHAKRLVAAGHKVGVVRQIETAALKKAGDNRNAPFVRRLTNLYTKGTYVDEHGELDAPQSDGSAAPGGGYLLCITETVVPGAGGADEKVSVGIVAVQPATGDIIHDSFEDGFMRSEVETRLLHISPCEFLIVGDLTRGTEKLIEHLSGSSTNVFGDRSRVERVPRSKTTAAEAYSQVTQFYADKAKARSDESGSSGEQLLDKVLQLPENVTVCLAAMIAHLAEYGLQHVFDLTRYFQSFSTRLHMLVGGTTLESLEVYRNSTDHREKGSLFWALDKTVTRSGRRLLRKWVGRPLLDRDRIEERVAAVEELLSKQSTAKADQLETLLRSTKTDLERSLIRIYYGKCSRPELLSVLQTLQRTAAQYAHLKTPDDTGFASPLISSAILALPPILDVVVPFLDRINSQAAGRDDKYLFFREGYETEAMTDHRFGIAAVEQELDAHRADAARQLGRKTPVEYVTVAGIEYLVEVTNADIKRVPASWAKISGTKRVSRFHTPDVVRLVAERDQYREALAAACDAAFADLLRAIAAEYQPLRDAVAALSTLDCLLSLSKVAALPGYSRPTILPSTEPPSVCITAGRHPMAEHLLPDGYIPFTARLASPSPLAYLITGPNMGGKSSFVRAVALIVLLAQVGSFVPADGLTLTLCDAIFTRMGARDNLFAGESTFMVEVSETARILRSATPRSLVVLDELGRGTSTHDGAAIAQAVLEHVVRETRCLTLFITHYQNLARVASGLDEGLVKNVHMRFTATKRADVHAAQDEIGDGNAGADADADADEEITFLYEVAEGMAHRSYGLNVARLARVPRRVLDMAAQKSRELELRMKERMLKNTSRLLENIMRGDGNNVDDQLDYLISSIQQL